MLMSDNVTLGQDFQVVYVFERNISLLNGR